MGVKERHHLMERGGDESAQGKRGHLRRAKINPGVTPINHARAITGKNQSRE